ncbi:alpha/beta hydrolase [Chryseobacterium sp. G0162]|uniref:alpha/beta hydrolase n=1 Tax=Chryseobacterium sp. G0162 TaxID=2487063 RepID=UPI000F4D34B1|nr:alpha/beta hydrolase [Chryseobacterium sp. G0162]AZB07779.1 alpha/beta hydrolase [Chryseobacterium sp. G0162]
MKTYQTNKAWKQLNELLPVDFQITDHNLPLEEVWQWKGNNIHLDRYPNPTAEYRIFLHHGVGTNGRQMNMIFGHQMAALGYEVVAIDNLGYGMTEVNQKDITYDDWVHCFADFVNSETKRDYKKPVLYGLSAGGMVCYNSACFMNEVHGIIGMCFLKNDDKTVGKETAKFGWANGFMFPMMNLLNTIGFKRFQLPMKAVSKMNFLTNNEKALKIFLNDDASAGANVQMQFLYEYMNYHLPIPVTEFNKCPILLTQPDKDRWTPLHLSQRSMKGIKAPFTVKLLENGGHYPMEKTALVQLIQYADEFITSLK